MQIANPFNPNKMIHFKLLSALSSPKFLLAYITVAPILAFIEKYMFNDWSYLKFMFIACTLDFITGVTKVWVRQGSAFITSKGFRDSISKIVQYGAFIIITHVLTHFEINGVKYVQLDWFDSAAYIALILIEGKSVYENIVAINPKMDFLRPVIKKLDLLINKEKPNEGN
jgi:hypothetical protein